MKCIHCQGTMEKGTTPLHIDRKGCHLQIDAVPARVCTQCGEPRFAENQVDAIQDLIESIEHQTDALALSA